MTKEDAFSRNNDLFVSFSAYEKYRIIIKK